MMVVVTMPLLKNRPSSLKTRQWKACLLTRHLDLGQRIRMLALFREEAHVRGRTVIAVLHDLNLAAAFADRIVLLVCGTVLADGPPADVITAEHVEQAFGTPVQIVPHPEHGAPFVMPLQEAAS